VKEGHFPSTLRFSGISVKYGEGTGDNATRRLNMVIPAMGTVAWSLAILRRRRFTQAGGCHPMDDTPSRPRDYGFSSHPLNDKAAPVPGLLVIYWMTTADVVRRQRPGFLVIH
jgi:hypothetical protein